MTKEAQESLEQSFTPSLARRLSRTFIEQTRQSLPYETRYRSPSRETVSLLDTSEAGDRSVSTISDQTEYKQRPANRSIRRTNSLLETASRDRDGDRSRRSPRRSVRLFDDDYDADEGHRHNDENDDDADVDESNGYDRSLPPFPGQVMTLGRKYKDASGKSATGKLRRENFHPYRTEKIQEETTDADNAENNGTDNGSISECTSVSVCTSNTNPQDATSSLSAKSYETSPTESSSNPIDYKSIYARSDHLSRNFENRLLAAENLIKESKLKNLGPSKFNPNLTSSYRDTDKCEKQSLISIAEATGSSGISKRRTCIPSLRLRSGSLTREPGLLSDRRKSSADSQDRSLGSRATSPEKSLLRKLFKASGSREADSRDKEKEKPQKSKQHRISRFLRPDFFDTPREESRYVKEKEEQKAAENERRKSRFIKRKNEKKSQESVAELEKRDKELKNEINSLRKDRRSEDRSEEKSRGDSPEECRVARVERQESRKSFLHSLERKLEKLGSDEDAVAKPVANGAVANEAVREHSAPPAAVPSAGESNSSGTIKKAISVEDLSSKKPRSSERQSSAKSRVSSVLGLFRSADAKQAANGGARTQNAFLSRLKKSPPKSARADASSVDDAPSTSSKIPTKFAKTDSKPAKKLGEARKQPAEKLGRESPKRSPSKEKPKQEKSAISAKERRPSNEKDSKETKRVPTDSREISNEGRDTLEESAGKQPESMSGDAAMDKKQLKTKRNRSLAESSSSMDVARRDEPEKLTVPKKPVKPNETAEGSDADGAKKKKKKIVRVVKKVVKKSSDSSESKTEEKGKSGKAPTTKRSPEPAGPSLVAKNGVGSQPLAGRSSSSARSSYTEAKLGERAEVEQNAKPTAKPLGNSLSKKPSPGKSVEETAAADTKNHPESQRANRSNLKLDLSKIPHHSFRNNTTKKDSPKSESDGSKSAVESPKTAAKEDVPDKLMECLSKVTHRASITGNKIIIDKPLRAKDVAELKREVTECARMIESHAESSNNDAATRTAQRLADICVRVASEEKAEERTPPPPPPPVDSASSTETTAKSSKGSPVDYANEPFSPVDEPNSFDSWSVSSAELNHARPDLHSPTSPSHALFARSDNSDSVIDRIRRRSFYSRFNDRRRPSLTAPPPGLGLTASTALPRKYSFSGHRENRERSKYGAGYGLAAASKTSHGDRGYNLYGDENVGIGRNRSLERPNCKLYSDATIDLKSPTEHLPPLSSSYDPLRRYLRSPTFELSASRAKYHSADFSVDSDLGSYGSYRTPLSSLLNDTAVESHATAFPSSALPRKYGSTTVSEPKTVEYYEELLAPTCSDYLPVRRSPISSEYLNRSENGYYNGNAVDLHFNGGKRKAYAESSASSELTEQSDQHGSGSSEQRR